MKLENLQKIRKENNLTQQDCARIFKVTKSTYQKWELGKAQPSIESFLEIADYFKISLDFLFNRKFNKISEEENKKILETIKILERFK